MCVTREWNVARKGQKPVFKQTLKSSRVAVNHLPKEIFAAILRTSFLSSTARS